MIDNWYFANPINQRGQTSYTGAVYGIDRWMGRNADTGVTIKTGYIEISQTKAGSQAGINQSFAGVAELAGKTVTFSAIARGDGLCAPALRIRTAPDAPATTNVVGEKDAEWQLLSITVTLGENAQWGTAYNNSVYWGFYFTAQSDISSNPHVDFYAAKLEFGTQQTLAYQDEAGNWVLNDPPPDYYLELERCKLYYRPPQEQLVPVYIAQEIGYCRVPLVMRANPAIIANALGSVSLNGNSYPVTGVSTSGALRDWGIQFTLTIPGAPGSSIGMYRSNSLAFNADL